MDYYELLSNHSPLLSIANSCAITINHCRITVQLISITINLLSNYAHEVVLHRQPMQIQRVYRAWGLEYGVWRLLPRVTWCGWIDCPCERGPRNPSCLIPPATYGVTSGPP